MTTKPPRDIIAEAVEDWLPADGLAYPTEQMADAALTALSEAGYVVERSPCVRPQSDKAGEDQQCEMRYNESGMVTDFRDYEKYLRGEVVKSEGLSSEVYFRGRADGVNDCIAKLRAMELVSNEPVSLMDCVIALQDNEKIKVGANLQEIAKTVLNAAGVNYHED